MPLKLRRLLVPLTIRGALAAIFTGIIATYLVAWSCAMWTPAVLGDISFSENKPIQIDGKTYRFYMIFNFIGLYEIVAYKNNQDFMTDLIQGGNQTQDTHQFSGLPFPALHSRIKVVSFNTPIPQADILNRGLATNNLPAFLHARPDRRLSLVPDFPGFLLDTLIFALLFHLVLRPVVRLIGLRRSQGPGFPVLPKPSNPSQPHNPA